MKITVAPGHVQSLFLGQGERGDGPHPEAVGLEGEDEFGGEADAVEALERVVHAFLEDLNEKTKKIRGK